MLRAIKFIVATFLHGGFILMKNFKLLLCDALIAHLVDLASLEKNALFQDVYLDTLRACMNARTQLRRRAAADRKAHTSAARVSGCCARNA